MYTQKCNLNYNTTIGSQIAYNLSESFIDKTSITFYYYKTVIPVVNFNTVNYYWMVIVLALLDIMIAVWQSVNVRFYYK